MFYGANLKVLIYRREAYFSLIKITNGVFRTDLFLAISDENSERFELLKNYNFKIIFQRMQLLKEFLD
jgi:hypothetical protein